MTSEYVDHHIACIYCWHGVYKLFKSWELS